VTPKRWGWLIAALFVAGAAIRIAVQVPLHRFANDADCATIGFGAWEILAGDLRIFVSTAYRQGALSCYAAAAASLFVGPGRAALALEVIFVGIAQMLLWWAALLELTGWNWRSAQSMRLLLFIVLPSPAVLYWAFYWPMGYPEIFLAATLVLWAGARFWRRGGAPNLLVYGLAAGFGFWMSPLTLAVTIPTSAWLVWQGPREVLSLRRIALLVAGGLIGGSPWLIFNLRYDWASLTLDWTARPARGLGAAADNAGRLFGKVLPTLLASMAPGGFEEWETRLQRILEPAALALVALALAVLARAAYAALGNRGAPEGPPPGAGKPASEAELLALLALSGGILVTLSALFIFSAAGGAPGNIVRYTLPVALVWPLLLALAWEAAGRRVRALFMALSLIVLAGFSSAVPWPWTAKRESERAELAILHQMVDRLEANGVEAVFGPFWEVYPVIFESGGRLAGSTLEPLLDTHRYAARLPEGPCRWALVGKKLQIRRLVTEAGFAGQVERFADGRRLFVVDPLSTGSPAGQSCNEVLHRLRAEFRR
jgi:hypothetical protein